MNYVKLLSKGKKYDETYQMLLLCFLECENIERNKKISGLKEVIEK